MILLFAITEDSILKVFDGIFEFKKIKESIRDIYDLPKAYFFPRIYLFYDEINVSPIPTIKVQYADTINLRLVDKEIDLGYPKIRRWGFGVFWNPLNPQIILYTLSAKTLRDFEISKFEVMKENLKNNLRIYLRILSNLDSMINLSDSLISLGERLIRGLDTMRNLGILEEDKILYVKAEIGRVRELRGKILRSKNILKGFLEEYLKIDLENLTLSEDFTPKCLDAPDSLKIKALHYRNLGESIWWFPKFYIFGEVWNGNVREPSTLAGFRISLEFDESRRLKSRSASSVIELERLKRKIYKGKFEIVLPVLTDLSAYRNLVDVSWKYYQGGALSLADYFKVYSDYVRIRTENILNRINNLSKDLCEEDYDHEKDGEY